MHLQVKYGLITLINQEADGCETIEKADLECPLAEGEMTLTKDVNLPKEIPPVRISQTLQQGQELTGNRAHTPYSLMYTRKRVTRLLV